MTHESSTPSETASQVAADGDTPGGVSFGMVVIYARDLRRSIDFYRLVGLDISDPHPEQPVAAWQEGAATRLIITTDLVAQRFDAHWVRPERGGYQQVVEFFVKSDEAVDAAWRRLTAAGYTGTSSAGHLLKPYATMVEDPDGNVVLITHEREEDRG